MSVPAATAGGDLARRRVRRLQRRPGDLGRARRRGAGARCSSSAPAPAGWRCDLAGGGHRVVAVDRSASRCSDELRRARRGARARGRDGLRRRPPRSSSGASLRRGARADAARPPARRRRRAAPSAARRRPPPPGRRRSRSPPRCSPTRASLGAVRPATCRRCPTCVRSTAGSTRACRLEVRRGPGGIEIRRLRQVVSPAGELSRGARRDPARLADRRTSSSSRPSAAGLTPRERIEIDRHRRARRLDRLRAGGRLMELRLLALYPEQMNIYADRGNILFLRRRCEWRGIGFSHAGGRPRRGLRPGAPTTSIYIGGGQDRDQELVAEDMLRDQARRARSRGRRRRRRARRLRRLPAARPQLPARRPADRRASACVDLETVREPGPRLIGNVAIEAELGGRAALEIAGFENHGGRTYLGAGARAARPGDRRPRQQRHGRVRGRPPRRT